MLPIIAAISIKLRLRASQDPHSTMSLNTGWGHRLAMEAWTRFAPSNRSTCLESISQLFRIMFNRNGMQGPLKTCKWTKPQLIKLFLHLNPRNHTWKAHSLEESRCPRKRMQPVLHSQQKRDPHSAQTITRCIPWPSLRSLVQLPSCTTPLPPSWRVLKDYHRWASSISWRLPRRLFCPPHQRRPQPIWKANLSLKPWPKQPRRRTFCRKPYRYSPSTHYWNSAMGSETAIRLALPRVRDLKHLEWLIQLIDW